MLHVLAFARTDVDLTLLEDGRRGMARFISDAFPPNLDWPAVIKPGFDATLVTLWISLLGTALSIPSALILAVLTSRTTSVHPEAYQISRTILSVFRAVPDIVFALVFVTAVGLGPFAGVLALTCHNTGVMGKLWAESMEETDQGPQEALATAGASRLQQITHVSLPLVFLSSWACCSTASM